MKLYFAFTCGWFILLFLNALLTAHIMVLKNKTAKVKIELINGFFLSAFLAVPTYFFYTYLLEH